jgi:S1-C subfamily serine protease
MATPPSFKDMPMRPLRDRLGLARGSMKAPLEQSCAGPGFPLRLGGNGGRGGHRRMTISGGLLAIAALPLVACSGNGGGSIALPSFSDVSDAPPAIRAAAQAVVRISTAGELATGSFISATGVLLTNNHVLGVDICPIEGCYAQITFLYQRHSARQTPQTVFVVPVGLDMAVVQVYDRPGGPPLDTPSFLTLASRSPVSLVGTHVNVVGHPEGNLKKWTQGTVSDTDGTWILFTASLGRTSRLPTIS